MLALGHQVHDAVELREIIEHEAHARDRGEQQDDVAEARPGRQSRQRNHHRAIMGSVEKRFSPVDGVQRQLPQQRQSERES